MSSQSEHPADGRDVSSSFFPVLEAYHGETFAGPSEVLSVAHQDPVHQVAWRAEGYLVAQLPGAQRTAQKMYQSMGHYISTQLLAEGLSLPTGQGLADYHRTAGLTDAIHVRVARWGVPFEAFGVNKLSLEAMVSENMGEPFKMLLLKNLHGQANLAGLRVIRPGQQDHNPFHRDGWLPCYHKTVNLWVPLAHCGAGSSLRVYSGSHLWPESDLLRTPTGASYRGRQYTVPALVALRRLCRPTEPLPDIGQALLFSSFLLHGGAHNSNPDKTRLSCEFRFERA